MASDIVVLRQYRPAEEEAISGHQNSLNDGRGFLETAIVEARESRCAEAGASNQVVA